VPSVNSKIIRMRRISNWLFSFDEPLAAFRVHFGGDYFFPHVRAECKNKTTKLAVLLENFVIFGPHSFNRSAVGRGDGRGRHLFKELRSFPSSL